MEVYYGIRQKIRHEEKRRKEKVMGKGVKHYFRDGTEHKGGTHKMPNGQVHSGKSHAKTAKKPKKKAKK